MRACAPSRRGGGAGAGSGGACLPACCSTSLPLRLFQAASRHQLNEKFDCGRRIETVSKPSRAIGSELLRFLCGADRFEHNFFVVLSTSRFSFHMTNNKLHVSFKLHVYNLHIEVSTTATSWCTKPHSLLLLCSKLHFLLFHMFHHLNSFL